MRAPARCYLDCRLHILMPHQFLHHTNVSSVFEQMRRVAVPHRMATRALRDARIPHRCFYSLLQARFQNMVRSLTVWNAGRMEDWILGTKNQSRRSKMAPPDRGTRLHSTPDVACSPQPSPWSRDYSNTPPPPPHPSPADAASSRGILNTA